MDGYNTFARYYDRFVGADYQKITTFIDETIKQHFPSASLVCDIGCGSGTITLSLQQKGYDMIGIDGSPEMLSIAQEKRTQFSCGDGALFLCQELPEFELYGTVDAIVSTLDTLNYLTEKSDLERLFHWFRNYLNPKGLLIFDLNTLYKYQTLLDNHCEIYEDEDVFLAWRSQFNGDLCSHELNIFERSGERYIRTDEEQIQRYYEPTEIVALLRRYHFEPLGVWDNYTHQKPDDLTERLTFVARKED